MGNRRYLLAALILVGCLFVPLVVRSPYYMHLLIMSGINTILAMTFVLMLRTGLISLAIAAFWGMGAYASTLFVMKLNLSFWLSLPAAAIVVGIIALGIGFVFVRNAGFGFLMLTAVLGMLIVVVFGNMPLVGGYAGIDGIPAPNPIRFPFLNSIAFSSKVPYYYLMLCLLFLVILIYSAFYGAWTGRAWMAIGLNPRLAESLGVNVFRYRLWAFVIGSATSGLAGSFYAHYVSAVIPGSFDVFKTIHTHIYAILGGVEFAFLGPLVGSLIMTLVPEFLRIAREIEPIMTGLLVILLILFLPRGILSLFGLRREGSDTADTIVSAGKKIKGWLRHERGKNGSEHAPGHGIG
jgi:branched-chain amino acid transport system permease protein